MPPLNRIKPQSRPLRPPLSKGYRATRARFFARNPHLYTLTTNSTRPQLAFLLNSTRHPTVPTTFLSRYITTETRNFIKQQSFLAGKYTIIGLIVTTAGLSWMWMLTQEMVDRDFPAPKEWTFLSKVVYHAARGLEVPGANEHGIVNWGAVGLAYRDLLKRLENPTIDGKDIVARNASWHETSVQAYDISRKGYEWKKSYYDTLMGCAGAAIELEDAVLDTTRNLMFKRHHMVGPSNRKAKKVPKRKEPNPKEEDCVPFYRSPESYYIQILETDGFTNKEKMDAALAFGTWLDFRGRIEEADSVYQHALDLAQDTVGSSPTKPTSIRSAKHDLGLLRKSTITRNILDATTALAIHLAQTGDTSSALPLFLSILQARRSAPHEALSVAPSMDSASTARQERVNKVKRTDLDAMQDNLSAFWSLLQASKFPEPAPSGNEPFVQTPDNQSDEAACMAYIGEILYASDPSGRDAGLNWTKSAIELAWNGYNDSRTSRDAKIKAVECLQVGTENRQKMIDLRLSSTKQTLSQLESTPAWKKLIPGLYPSASTLRAEEQRWKAEEKEAAEFHRMLSRGRVFEVGEGFTPMWGTAFLKEWIVPHLVGEAEEWRVL